jgi:hypothetical protein
MDKIMKYQSSEEELRNFLRDEISDKTRIIDKEKSDDAINTAVKKIVRSIKEVTDKEIQKTILTRFLRSEFGDQIVHVNHTEEMGMISLTIKTNKLSASIKNNECTDFTDNVGITYNAIYIDTPFILDELSHDFRRRKIHIGHRDYLLKCLSKPFDEVSIFNKITISAYIVKYS